VWQADERLVAIREGVWEVALADAIVHRVVAPVKVGEVFNEVVDKEEKIYVIDMFGWFSQVIRFVWLRFERRIVLTKMKRAFRSLRKRLLDGEHILYQCVWSGQHTLNASSIRSLIEIPKLKIEMPKTGHWIESFRNACDLGNATALIEILRKDIEPAAKKK